MTVFDRDKAHELLCALDDCKAKCFLEQTGLSNYSEKLAESGVIPLFIPFFRFMQVQKADDIRVTEDQLIQMGANLNEMVNLLNCRGVNSLDLMRNMENTKGKRRRIL